MLFGENFVQFLSFNDVECPGLHKGGDQHVGDTLAGPPVSGPILKLRDGHALLDLGIHKRGGHDQQRECNEKYSVRHTGPQSDCCEVFVDRVDCR